MPGAGCTAAGTPLPHPANPQGVESCSLLAQHTLPILLQFAPGRQGRNLDLGAPPPLCPPAQLCLLPRCLSPLTPLPCFPIPTSSRETPGLSLVCPRPLSFLGLPWSADQVPSLPPPENICHFPPRQTERQRGTSGPQDDLPAATCLLSRAHVQLYKG